MYKMKNLEDWIKEINKLEKKQKSIEKLISKETDSLILEGLEMLHGYIVEELFEAYCVEAELRVEAELLLRHEESYEPGAGETWKTAEDIINNRIKNK
tara:strand:+ start:809 stop:1102 length:294 start_codon:yes stop_codon:yes gene_type:complete